MALEINPVSVNMMPLSIEWRSETQTLILLNQAVLPGKTEFLEIKDYLLLCNAIKKLQVRGAPAIGIAAAYGLYLGLVHSALVDRRNLDALFSMIKKKLAETRPTAVNLFWALERMESRYKEVKNESFESILLILLDEAKSIHRQDEAICRTIGENSLKLLQPKWGLLTHCNAGGIATARYGTALAPIHLGQEKGYNFKVYADETRPLLQGARLTAWELKSSGVDVTVICDNMAASVMAQGKVQAVLVGCDRVAANGDSANKIGTFGLAVLAKYFKIPFYIHAPVSTIDFNIETGTSIPIEIRNPEEIRSLWYKEPQVPEDVKLYNPAFDVTPAELITAIITEKGVIYPPFGQGIQNLLK